MALKSQKKIIHVNRQHIAMNAKDGGNRPVYTVKTGGKTRYAREVSILGPSRMVYNGSQLNCGARAWIETDSDIELVDEMSFTEARKQKHKNPAKLIKMSDGSEIWMYKKKLHREDGPAVYIARTGKSRFYLNGEERSLEEWIKESGQYHMSGPELTLFLLKWNIK